MGKKTALILLAEGAEEMEAVIAIDVLRRGGIEVTVAGLSSDKPVKCSRDVVISPDVSLNAALKKGPYDVIVLPGGGSGADNLAASADVGKILKEQEAAGKLIGAICASPAVALVAHGIGHGKRVTCYPSMKDNIISTGKYTYVDDEDVVVDEMLVTSKGPGTAFSFAISLVEKLVGEEKAAKTAKPMLL